VARATKIGGPERWKKASGQGGQPWKQSLEVQRSCPHQTQTEPEHERLQISLILSRPTGKNGKKIAPPPRFCLLSKLESSNCKDSTTLLVPLSQFIARVSQFLNSMRLTDMISADHAFLSNYLSKMKTKVAVFQDRCLDSRLCYTLYFILQNHT